MLPDPIRSTALAVPHGFFTRAGGVSAGPYASLNCSLSSQDSREAVLENRARAARAIDAGPDALLGVTQVHGNAVVHVTDLWAAGNGPRADAMVTDRPGVALGIITADCAPVLLCDASAGIVGAAHAGWRGAVAGVLEATVAAMQALGARDIAAAIGPCIAQESYEVGADLRDAVLARHAADARFFVPGSREAHWQFDLAGYCALRLACAGVKAAAIGLDTLADEARFFSHRRRTLAGGGPIGHQISAIQSPLSQRGRGRRA
jgi:YfiH family protein